MAKAYPKEFRDDVVAVARKGQAPLRRTSGSGCWSRRTRSCDGIHQDDATLGYRFIADELADVGIVASENRVWRLCSTAGVFASHHRLRGKAGPAVHDDRLATVDKHGRVTHDFVGVATGPNQVWLTGPARHSDGALQQRSSPSSYRPCHRLVLHRPPEPAHFTSVAFTAELLEAGIAGSIGSVGDALDNALCESTIGLLKTEAIDDGGPTWTDRLADRLSSNSSTGRLRRRPQPGGRLTNHPPPIPGRFTFSC